MDYYGYSSTHYRLIGYTTKKAFIEAVSEQERVSKNWVSERLCATGNKFEIEAMDTRPGEVFKFKRE